MILKFLFWNFKSIMVDGVVVTASYRKDYLWTRTVGMGKPIKRTRHSQIHLLENEWNEPKQVSSLLKLLPTISISKREGHDILRRCGKMSINWPNVHVFRRRRRLMQNRKSTLRGLNYIKTMKRYCASCKKYTGNKNSNVRKTKQNRLSSIFENLILNSPFFQIFTIRLCSIISKTRFV